MFSRRGERKSHNMADCCVDLLGVINVFHMDSRATAVTAMSVASPVTDQEGGRSVESPWILCSCFSLCTFPTL